MNKILVACTAALQAVGLRNGGRFAPRHALRRSRITKVIAGATTALLAAGLGVTGVAMSASAHHNTISATAVCSTTTPGTWVVTWKIQNSEATRAEVVSASSDTSLVPINTAIAAGGSISKTENVSVAADKTLTLTGHWYVAGSYDESSVAVGTISAASFPKCAPAEVHSTGAYYYKLLDTSKPASWQNSGPQTRFSTWDGWSFKDPSALLASLPAGVCGTGWGVQEDQIIGAQSLFPLHITYPNDGGFNGQGQGVLHDSRHYDLRSLPDCPTTTIPTQAVTAVDFSCGVVGSIAIPAITGVAYEAFVGGSAVGQSVAAGRLYATGNWKANGAPLVGTITIKAFKSGTAEITGTKAWTFTFSQAKTAQDCATKPAPEHRTVTSYAADCSLKLTTTTTNYTTEYVWNGTQYVKGTEVAGAPVVTTATTTAAHLTQLGIDVPVCTVPATTATDVCGVVNDTLTVPADTAEIAYTNADQRVAGVGTVTVTAAAKPGFAVPSTVLHEWTFEFTDATCPSIVLTAEADPSDQTCVDGVNGNVVTSGYITVVLKPHVTYRIVGAGVDINPVTTTKTDVAPGDYTVTATADTGYSLTVDTWDLKVKPGLCIPTLADLETNVTSTNEVCTAGAASGGTITLGQVNSSDMFGVGVSYFIDGVKATKSVVTKPAGTYHVTAVLDDPTKDTLVLDSLTSWTVVIGAAGTVCGDLTTLAFTGVNGNLGGMLMVALFLLLGGAGVYTTSRIRARKN